MEQLLSAEEVATVLKVPVKTIYHWRYMGNRGPRAHRVGRHLRYRLSDIEAWLEANADPREAV